LHVDLKGQPYISEMDDLRGDYKLEFKQRMLRTNYWKLENCWSD